MQYGIDPHQKALTANLILMVDGDGEFLARPRCHDEKGRTH